MLKRLAAALLLSAPLVLGAPNCDNEYGTLCPASMPGSELVECLAEKKGEGGEISADCTAWLDIMTACTDDLESHCSQSPGDEMVCLTQWTDASKLTAGCTAALPVKEAPKPAAGGKKKKKKKSRAAQKRRAYEKNLEDYEKRKEEEAVKEEKKGGKPAKKKKSKKKKKKAKKNGKTDL